MRILATVLARGGSKRVPGKNLRLVGGKPLILRAVEAALEVPEICAILTSTDDPEIAAIAAAAGSLVPWLRPASLATDTATSLDACLHALDWFEEHHGLVDGLMLLQPTAPFRTRDCVLRAVGRFEADRLRPVVGVSPARSHPFWCFRLDDDSLRPFMPDGDLNARSQELPAAYVINGAIYVASPEHLRGRRSFFAADMRPLLMSEHEGFDIDTEDDLKLAQILANDKEQHA